MASKQELIFISFTTRKRNFQVQIVPVLEELSRLFPKATLVHGFASREFLNSWGYPVDVLDAFDRIFPNHQAMINEEGTADTTTRIAMIDKAIRTESPVYFIGIKDEDGSGIKEESELYTKAGKYVIWREPMALEMTLNYSFSLDRTSPSRLLITREMPATALRLTEQNTPLTDVTRQWLAKELKDMANALYLNDEDAIARRFHYHQTGEGWITHQEWIDGPETINKAVNTIIENQKKLKEQSIQTIEEQAMKVLKIEEGREKELY